MNGMIFAAGLGTRLKPLTNDRPKALVELNGRPLLEHVVLKMKHAGVRRIVVNIHHYADLIEDFLRAQHNFGCDIVVSDERDCLLDTGGGLLKAKEMFEPGEPVLIHNVDILSELDLGNFIRHYYRNPDYATLVTCKAASGRGFRFNKDGLLKGWENTITGEQKIVDEDFVNSSSYSFCGIHIVSSDFLQNMSGKGVFSIVDEYLYQARRHKIGMYFYSGYLLDLGTPEAIAEAEKRIIFQSL